MRTFLLTAPFLWAALCWPEAGLRAAEPAQYRSLAEMEMKQASVLLGELTEECRQLQAAGYVFDPQERFIDAQVYFDLGHFGQAALLLTSLVDDERFKRDKSYYDALRMLGIAFYNEGNYQAADTQFQKLLAAGIQADVAVNYLVEIALRLRRHDELQKLAATIASLGASTTLRYARGKALYFIGRYNEALDALKGIGSGTNESLKAEYVIGASLVALKRTEDARNVFLSLIQKQARDDQEKKILEMAHLALGRISYELGDFSAAADYYQQIDRRSDYFEHALFEATHVYLAWAQKKTDPVERVQAYGRAEEILNALVDIAKDPEIARDARTIRGRINMFLEKYELAQEAYQEVIELFAATSSELTDIAQSPETIARFFQAMITGGDSSKELSLIASAEVVGWMKAQPTLGSVVSLLTDVGNQRQAMGDAQKVYQQLDYSLSQESARELFPGFSDVWLKSLEAENHLLEADRLLLEAEAAAVGKELSQADKDRLRQYLDQREALQKKLANAPRSVVAYRARSQQNVNRIRTMTRDADEQVLRIDKIQEQITAMQKLLKEVKYRGSTALQVKGEASIAKDIDKEGMQVVNLLKEAQALRAEIEKELLLAEVVDPRGRSEQDVKASLWKLHGTEAAFFIDLAKKLDPATQDELEKANKLRREITTLRDFINDQRGILDKKASEQIKYYRKVLEKEKVELEARERELKTAEQAATQFANSVGSTLFLEAKERLVKAVVEADLGLVDLMWHKKQIETDRIEEIQAERAKVGKRLQDELREVAGDTQQEE
jgi:tetratricopeptide (TPR) repeat protein